MIFYFQRASVIGSIGFALFRNSVFCPSCLTIAFYVKTLRCLKTANFITNPKIYNTWYFRLMPEALEPKNWRPVRFSVSPFLRFSVSPFLRGPFLNRFPMSYRLAVFCIRSQFLSICSEIGALVCQLDRSRTILLKHVQNHVFWGKIHQEIIFFEISFTFQIAFLNTFHLTLISKKLINAL